MNECGSGLGKKNTQPARTPNLDKVGFDVVGYVLHGSASMMFIKIGQGWIRLDRVG